MSELRPADTTEPSAVPFLPDDWPQQVTERVVGGVDTVRSKTTGPAIRISRAVVYGLVAALVGLVAVPLLLIGATRLLISSIDSGFLWFIPGTDRARAVWIAYLALGTIFTLGGLAVWSRRPRGAATPA